jgi:hypothetical protein
MSVASRRPAARAVLALGLAVLTTACYTTQPLLGPPPAGARVVATLNDRGRAAMSDSVGPAVDRAEGTVARSSDSSFVLSMRRTYAFGGNETPWAGEALTFRMSSLRALELRRPSRGRSVALALGLTAAVAAIVLGTTIRGSGGGETEGTPPPPQGQ